MRQRIVRVPVSPDVGVSVSNECDGMKRQPTDGVDQSHRDHHLHHLSIIGHVLTHKESSSTAGRCTSCFVKIRSEVSTKSGGKKTTFAKQKAYDIRKFNFTNRVIPVWNSLSNHVVSADTVNCFKKSFRQVLV